jgi:hypothetical protein
MDPFTLGEFDKITKKLGLDGKRILRRKFQTEREDWNRIIRDLFFKE